VRSFWKKGASKNLDMTKYETGLEGIEIEDIEAVDCPVNGAPLSIGLCKDCNYHGGMEKRSRGRHRGDKKMIVCNAPRLLPVKKITVPGSGCGPGKIEAAGLESARGRAPAGGKKWLHGLLG